MAVYIPNYKNVRLGSQSSMKFIDLLVQLKGDNPNQYVTNSKIVKFLSSISFPWSSAWLCLFTKLILQCKKKVSNRWIERESVPSSIRKNVTSGSYHCSFIYRAFCFNKILELLLKFKKERNIHRECFITKYVIHYFKQNLMKQRKNIEKRLTQNKVHN